MKLWKIIFLIFLVVASVMIIANEPPYLNNKGYIFIIQNSTGRK